MSLTILDFVEDLFADYNNLGEFPSGQPFGAALYITLSGVGFFDLVDRWGGKLLMWRNSFGLV